jgi:hypothetical protein
MNRRKFLKTCVALPAVVAMPALAARLSPIEDFERRLRAGTV